MKTIQKFICFCILSGFVPCATGETRDVVFVLDRSGSINQGDFDDAVDFVYNVVIWLTIGQSFNQLQISVLTFESSTVEEFDLNDYTSKSALLAAINQIKSKRTGGGTHTHEALRYCAQTSFTSGHGSRTGVPKAVVVLTDGQSNNPSQTKTQAEILHKAGYEVYSIGVGLSTSASELAAIASDPDSYYVNTVDTFADLCNIIPVLVPKLDRNVLSSVKDECAYLNPTSSTTTAPPKSKAATMYAIAATFAVVWITALMIVIAKVVSVKMPGTSSVIGAGKDNLAVQFHQSDIPTVEIISTKDATKAVHSK